MALIAIIGYGVQAFVATWPDKPPSHEWVILQLGLGVIAFFFYREDKAYKKDPGIREATVTAATDDLMNKFAEVLVERIVGKMNGAPKEETVEEKTARLEGELEALKAEG